MERHPERKPGENRCDGSHPIMYDFAGRILCRTGVAGGLVHGQFPPPPKLRVAAVRLSCGKSGWENMPRRKFSAPDGTLGDLL